MLDALLTLVAGLILLGCLLFFYVAAVAMNTAEHNRKDFDRRHQARADAHEALARSECYPRRPDSQVERRWSA